MDLLVAAVSVGLEAHPTHESVPLSHFLFPFVPSNSHGTTTQGVLLGLINIVVSGLSLMQGPLVAWAERAQDYTGANTLLLLATLPLFGVVYGTVPPQIPKQKVQLVPPSQRPARGRVPSIASDDEETMLLAPGSSVTVSQRLSFRSVLT